MKSLKEFLTESRRQYKYRIKLAGDISSDFLKQFEKCLSKFDLVRMSDVKATPIQGDPYGFPGLKNLKVSMIDVEMNYPANGDQIIAIAKMLGHDPDHIKIVTSEFDETNQQEHNDREQSPLLDKDYPEPTREQKTAGKNHATGNQQVIQNAADTEMKFAAPKTPAAKTTNELPMGTKSPMGSTKVTLPDIKSAAR